MMMLTFFMLIVPPSIFVSDSDCNGSFFLLPNEAKCGVVCWQSIGWLPDSLKQQIIDSVVTSVADKAENVSGDEFGQAFGL